MDACTQWSLSAVTACFYDKGKHCKGSFSFPCIHLCLLVCVSTCSVLSGGRLLSGSSQRAFSEGEGSSRWDSLRGHKLDQLREDDGRRRMTWFYKTLGCLEAKKKKPTHSENENSDSSLLSFLYFSSLSLFNTLLLPPLCPALCVSNSYLVSYTSNGAETDSQFTSSTPLLRQNRQLCALAAHGCGSTLAWRLCEHTLCRTQRCAWLCEKAFRTHKCPVVS